LKKKSVAGQHVFITGGASGIGKQMAIKFAKLGALVILLNIVKVTIVDIN
jgi:all-trans-retinol dehydrogenase (NAD+)